MKTKLTILAVGVLLGAAQVASNTANAQTNFIKITTGPVVTTSGHFSSCAWGDYDNDGLIDLFVGGGGSPNDSHNFLFHNEGNGTFISVSGGSIVTDISQSYGNSWGDYDNDGFLDLFVGNSYAHGDRSFLYHNEGEGTFTKITSGPVVENFGNFSGCAWGDFDKDGYLDLFVCNSGNPNVLYRNKGDGTFQQITTGDIVSTSGDSLVVAWSDYDNDGHIDLFVARGFSTDPGGEANLLYHSNGDGTFTLVTAGIPTSDLGHSVGAAWGDYDNDGFPDLFVVNGNGSGSQKNFLFHNDGNETFAKVVTGSIVNDAGAWLGCAWGDYDNDGYLDLVVGGHEGRNGVYHNNGDGTFTRITTGPIAQSSGTTGGCAWGDYDNDGFLDLVVTSWAPDPDILEHNSLFHNTGNGNAWLNVRCVGTVSNRSAIGAKVRVKATIAGKTFWQLREITPGDGFNGNSLIAHFGLGDATNIDALRIEWPSGTVQIMTNVPVRQSLTMTEPPTLQALRRLPDSSIQLSLTGGIGFRYDLETSSDLASWTPWASLICTNRTMTLTGTNAITSSKRFYRAVMR